MLSIFSCGYWSFVYLMREISSQALCPFFNWVVWGFLLLLLSCRSLLYILDINLLLDTWFFLPLCELPFHSLDCFFHLVLTLGNTKNLFHK